VRVYLTDTANTRIFNVTIPGARMKLVAGDNGRYEHEEWIDAVLLAPSERAVVDVMLPDPGTFSLEHRTPETTYRLGTITVTAGPETGPPDQPFETLRTNPQLAAERARLDDDHRRPPEKTLFFDASMPLLYGDTSTTADTYACPMHPEVTSTEPGTCPKCGMKLVPSDGATASHGHHEMHHDMHHDAGDGLEWEDLMPEINAQTDESNMLWKLVDGATSAENTAIDWTFTVGERIKIRLVNTMDSDHPMHHPFHIHGAGRFLVIDRDGQPPTNLAWKDTVLVRAGETADILLEVTEPGLWMAHCHIAEHNQDGMMFSFRVDPT
jgi:FtsP/CotA-like multicopper oxidase with cupredoxin domain